MKKKYYFFLLFILLLINQCKKDHIKTFENYLKYIKNGRNKEAYNLLSLEDKSFISFKEYQEEQYTTPISKNIIRRLKYKIIDSYLSGTKQNALIKVEIIQPDLVKIYTLLPDLVNSNYTEKQIDRIFRANKKIIDNENNKIKTIKDYKLILEDKEWKVYADYEKKKYFYNLEKEADKYYENNKLVEALAKYEEVLGFEENDKILNRVSSIKEKLYYIKKYLKISYNVLKKNKNGVIIEITIKNIGTIIVKKVVIDFLFYNNEIVIHKERRDLIESPEEQINFNKEIRKKVVLNDFKTVFSQVDCAISAIGF